MSFWGFVWLALKINVVTNAVLWLVSVVKKNVTVVDPFWGLGFAVMATGLWLAGPPATARGVLVVAMLWIWGLRYALHLYWRQWGHSEETTYYPYREWRERAGDSFWWVSLFRVFVPQALGTTLVGLPALVAMHAAGRGGFSLLDAAGVLVWFAGFATEAVADYQLACFKHDPANRGEVLRHGLWGYSRHPNYFGDALMWWGMWLVALSTGHGFWTVVSPAVMTFLLMRVSGVTMVEDRSAVGRRPGYAEYVRTVSPFVPRPPSADR